MRWQVGDVRVTKILELEFPPIAGPDFIFPEATPAAMLSIPWLQPHYIDGEGRLRFSFHALVVETPTLRIVVDTCFGNDKQRGIEMDGLSTNFLQDLTAAGYSPESIDVVVCTHLHIDHVGWNTRLVDGRWLPTFPNARYLISRAEYEHWSQQQEDALHRKVFADSVQPVWDAGLVDLVPTDHVLCPEVLLVPTPGHTPGHVSVRICSAGQQAVITGDFIHHPFQFARPEWSARIDHDSHQSVLTRREAFSRFIADNVLVIGTHFNNPSAGHVRSDSDSFRFEV